MTPGAMDGGATLWAAPESMTELNLTHWGCDSSLQEIAFSGRSLRWLSSAMVRGHAGVYSARVLGVAHSFPSSSELTS